MSDLLDRIVNFNAGRNPALVAIKLKRMQKDAFAFFRGTCHLFYEDLPANAPISHTPPTYICGDLHLQNFGVYQGDDGLIYFDINDFDESLFAPAAWDIARFLTSLLLAFYELSLSERNQLLKIYLDSYTQTLMKGQMRATHPALTFPTLQRVMQSRARRSLTVLLSDYTSRSRKTRQLKAGTSKMSGLDKAEYQYALVLLNQWQARQPEPDFYKACDIGSRLSGLGSMGVERYLVLVEGPRSADKEWLLEIKQRLDPAPLPYVPQQQPQWEHAAERVVTLQNRLQAVPPAPLAPIVHEGKAYTIRQLYPADTKINFNDFEKLETQSALIETMGRVTAFAHLRGCTLAGSSSVQTLIDFASNPAWHKSVLDHARDYSHQVMADYKKFCAFKPEKVSIS